VPIEAEQVIAPVPRRARKQRTSTAAPIAEETSAGTEIPTESSTEPSTEPKIEVFTEDASSVATEAAPTEEASSIRAEDLTTARPRHRITSAATKAAAAGGHGLVVVDENAGQGLLFSDPDDPNFRPPANVNPSFFGPLPRFHEVGSLNHA
jgi:hypothetical protein